MIDQPNFDGPRTQGELDFAFIDRIDRVLPEPLRFVAAPHALAVEVSQQLEGVQTSWRDEPDELLNWASFGFRVDKSAADLGSNWFYAGEVFLNRDSAKELYLTNFSDSALPNVDDFEACAITVVPGSFGERSPYGFLRQTNVGEVMFDVVCELAERAKHSMVVVRTTEPALAFSIVSKATTEVDINFAYSDSWNRSLQVAGPGGEDRASLYEALAVRSRDQFVRALQAVHDFNNVSRDGDREQVPVAAYRLAFRVPEGRTSAVTTAKVALAKNIAPFLVELPNLHQVHSLSNDDSERRSQLDDVDSREVAFRDRATQVLKLSSTLLIQGDVFLQDLAGEVVIGGHDPQGKDSPRRSSQSFSIAVHGREADKQVYTGDVRLFEPRLDIDRLVREETRPEITELSRDPYVSIEIARSPQSNFKWIEEIPGRSAVADAASQILVNILNSTGELNGYITTNDATLAQAIARRQDCRRAEVIVGFPELTTVLEGADLLPQFNMLLSGEIGRRMAAKNSDAIFAGSASLIPLLFDACEGELDAQFNFYFARM